MLHITPASATDAATIARLSSHVHQIHLDNVPHFFRQPTDDEVEVAFGRMLAQANVRAFIAYLGDAPAGYVLAVVNERPENEFCAAQRYVLVDQISVEPQWARQGIGQQLVQAVVDYARSIGVHELEALGSRLGSRPNAPEHAPGADQHAAGEVQLHANHCRAAGVASRVIGSPATPCRQNDRAFQ